MRQFDTTEESWRTVEAHIESRLATLRGRLEDPGTSDRERIGICGAIADLKALLRLPEANHSGDEPEVNPVKYEG